MSNHELSKAALNKLFHPSGTSGKPHTEEMQEMIALSIPKIDTGDYTSEYGVGYEEPVVGGDGTPTIYSRVIL